MRLHVPSRDVSSYKLTPRAVSDLDAIADYSLEHWGAAQTQSYLEQMTARFQWLADNPGTGRQRDDVAEGYRSFPEGKHVIFYVVLADGIAVIGLPHAAMDLSSLFLS